MRGWPPVTPRWTASPTVTTRLPGPTTAHFDATYRALWKPHSGLPGLIVGNGEEHVVDQRLRGDDPAFGRPHVLRRTIEGAAQFLWVENPRAVGAAFAVLTASLSRAS